MSHQRAQHVVTFILAAVVIIFAAFMFKANQKIMKEIQESSRIQDPVIPVPLDTASSKRPARAASGVEAQTVVDSGSSETAGTASASAAPKKSRVIYEMPISDDALVQ